MTGTGSAPSRSAVDRPRVRYSLLSLLVLQTACAISLGLVIQFPNITVWIVSIPVAVLTVIVLTPAAVDSYRRLFLRQPARLVPLPGRARLVIPLSSHHLLIGRNWCCDIVFFSRTVSRHHCRLYVVGRGWYVEDLHSQNGTYVNERRIRTRRLLIGDRISIADKEFIVQ